MKLAPIALGIFLVAGAASGQAWIPTIDRDGSQDVGLGPAFPEWFGTLEVRTCFHGGRGCEVRRGRGTWHASFFEGEFVIGSAGSSFLLLGRVVPLDRRGKVWELVLHDESLPVYIESLQQLADATCEDGREVGTPELRRAVVRFRRNGRMSISFHADVGEGRDRFRGKGTPNPHVPVHVGIRSTRLDAIAAPE